MGLGLVSSIAIALVPVVRASFTRPTVPPVSAVHYGETTHDGKQWLLEYWSGGAALEVLVALDADKVSEEFVEDRLRRGGRIEWTSVPGWARPLIKHPQTGAMGCGFPFVCLRGCSYTNMEGANEGHVDGLLRVRLFGRDVGIPLYPVPLGLAADTALYGTGWFLLFAGLAALRQWRRRVRGLCPRCAYDLGADQQGCPECGWGMGPSRA